MKYRHSIFLTVALLVSLIATSCRDKGYKMSPEEQEIFDALEGKEYFRFRDLTDTYAAQLPEERALYYEAFRNNLFNEKELSNIQISTLRNKYGESLPDSVRLQLLELEASNNLFIHRYALAAGAYKEIDDKHAHLLDSAQVEDIRNDVALWSTLKTVPQQRLEKHGDVFIGSERDPHGLVMVPVDCNGVECNFIFDTGANLSTIPLSMAERMGMTIYEADIRVGTITTIEVTSSLAVADRFRVGDLVYENAVFLVLPDEMLTFPGFVIDGIVGIPLIVQMEELHIERDGGVFIPAEPVDRGLGNLCFEDLTPVVLMLSGGDSLTLVFDSGATATDLSAGYFAKHEGFIRENGESTERTVGGAGGTMVASQYVLTDFPFMIGSKSGTLENVHVASDLDEVFNLKLDGNLGQDVFRQFDRMILNFRHMYIDFE